jgi:hypothetical protein
MSHDVHVPAASIYSFAIVCENVRIEFMLAALNDIENISEYIGYGYLYPMLTIALSIYCNRHENWYKLGFIISLLLLS